MGSFQILILIGVLGVQLKSYVGEIISSSKLIYSLVTLVWYYKFELIFDSINFILLNFLNLNIFFHNVIEICMPHIQWSRKSIL